MGVKLNAVSDPTQIHQVVMNLCTNACHVMRQPGGALTIKLEKVEFDQMEPAVQSHLAPGPYIRLSVGDTGHGMRAGQLAKIFDPFFTTKEAGEGTGLGMSVVQGIVKRHGGSLHVSAEPGQGATFEVYLPRIEAGRKALGADGEEQIPTGTEHVLFVDDEPPLVDIWRQYLKKLGYHCTGLTSSAKALALFESHPHDFDLVITDQTMPQMTGLEISREMLRIRPDISIIICSGFSDQFVFGDPTEIGIKRLVMKPLLISDLAKTIREILD